VDRFVDTDFYLEYTVNEHLTVHGTVLNVFDGPGSSTVVAAVRAGWWHNCVR
jgi:hypothetical protein